MNNSPQAVLVKDINPGGQGSRVEDISQFNGKLYFSANDGENGSELWSSDGTTAGTVLLKDLAPAVVNYQYGGESYNLPASSVPTNFIEFNGRLYFTAGPNSLSGDEIWSTDGTQSGTNLTIDIPPTSSYSYADSLTEYNGKLYFSARDAELGNELWVSDGTQEGTSLFADLNPGFSNSSPDNLTVVNGNLFFSANDGVNGDELWITDGTTEGTRLLADINPGGETTEFADGSTFYFPDSSNIGLAVEYNDKLYFSADDGVNGEELWVSDGTEAGTQLVADINPGSSGSNIFAFLSSSVVEFDGKLYFGANDGVNGRELWSTDGTEAGTQLVADINPGGSSSNVSSFTEFDGKLYFSANDGVNGSELWSTDGTEAGTQLVVDINPGSSQSSPSDLEVLNNELYFSANNGETGEELYKLTFEDVVNPGEPNAIDGTNASDNLTGTDNADIINGFGSPDTLNGGGGNDTLLGGGANDILDGGSGNDSLAGEAANDTLNGGDGEDTLRGGNGIDELFGGASDDLLEGEVNQDTLNGDDGNDTLNGGGGNDSLFGGNGNDLLNGEAADDTLDGGSGSDTLSGGDGRDLFILGGNSGNDTITDFNAGQDSFSLLGDLSFEDLTLTGNQIALGDSTIATVEGIDTTTLSAENFNEEPNNPDNPGEINNIEGTLDADLIEGTDNRDRIKGFAGDDVINALGGNDLVFGDADNDELDGGLGNDTVVGGTGNDTITGGVGNDRLVGQEGNDFFVLTPNEGTDTIADFDLQSDRLILSGGLVFEDLSFNNNSILAGDEIATLEGVDTTQLAADNFV